MGFPFPGPSCLAVFYPSRGPKCNSLGFSELALANGARSTCRFVAKPSLPMPKAWRTLSTVAKRRAGLPMPGGHLPQCGSKRARTMRRQDRQTSRPRTQETRNRTGPQSQRLDGKDAGRAFAPSGRPPIGVPLHGDPIGRSGPAFGRITLRVLVQREMESGAFGVGGLKGVGITGSFKAGSQLTPCVNSDA